MQLLSTHEDLRLRLHLGVFPRVGALITILSITAKIGAISRKGG